jgi:hypothetical protein
MFYLDFMLAIIGSGAYKIFYFVKKFRKPGVKGNLGSQPPQGVVVKAFKNPFLGVGQDVIEVNRVGGNQAPACNRVSMFYQNPRCRQ